MDKTQDVVMGVLSGPGYVFKYPGLEAYLESLSRCGYTGRKVMLVWNINPVARQALLQHDFELVEINPWPSEPFFHARMRLAWEYLKEHHKEFRFVFWFDIKDFIFQTDPSLWMEGHRGQSELIGSTECVTIEQEETNQIWARAILGEERYQEIKDEEVINGGTWAGTSEAMTEVFEKVHLGCKTYAGPYPPCQIWINYVMRQNQFKQVLRIPRWSEGFAACLHPVWWVGARDKCRPYLRDKAPMIHLATCMLHPGTVSNPLNESIEFNNHWGKDKLLSMVPYSEGATKGVECISNPSNKPFSVVHGYDRDWAVKELFEFKYRFGESYTFTEFKEFKDKQAANLRAMFKRPLRSPDVKNSNSRGNLPQTTRVFRRST